MKRHAALAQLSREHHSTLVLARAMRQATTATAAEETRRFLEHWQREECMHFRLEEEILLPAYAVHASPEHQLITRMLAEHVLIRRDATQLADRPSLELLHDLGERLDAHVRLEEREIFPLIESAIPEPDLLNLGERLGQVAQAAANGC